MCESYSIFCAKIANLQAKLFLINRYLTLYGEQQMKNRDKNTCFNQHLEFEFPLVEIALL